MIISKTQDRVDLRTAYSRDGNEEMAGTLKRWQTRLEVNSAINHTMKDGTIYLYGETVESLQLAVKVYLQTNNPLSFLRTTRRHGQESDSHSIGLNVYQSRNVSDFEQSKP